MTTTPTPSPEAEALPTLPVVAWRRFSGFTGWHFWGDEQAEPGSPDAQDLTPLAPAEAAIVALRAERDEACSARDAAINLANSRFDSMRAAQAEVAELRKDAERLDWLDANAGCEVSFQEVGDCEYAWQVHSLSGGRNDREWTLIGQGETPRSAIDAARATLLGDGGTL